MSPLARHIYKQLRRRVRAKNMSITYGELARELGDRRGSNALHPRSSTFHAALGEVSTACRDHRLPCLPAIVLRNDTRRPSDGYYKVAHPRARSERTRIAAWQREIARLYVEASRFPGALP